MPAFKLFMFCSCSQQIVITVFAFTIYIFVSLHLIALYSTLIKLHNRPLHISSRSCGGQVDVILGNVQQKKFFFVVVFGLFEFLQYFLIYSTVGSIFLILLKLSTNQVFGILGGIFLSWYFDFVNFLNQLFNQPLAGSRQANVCLRRRLSSVCRQQFLKPADIMTLSVSFMYVKWVVPLILLYYRLLDYQTTRLLEYQTTRLLDYQTTTRLLLDYYQTTTRLLQDYQTTTRLLDYYQTTTRLLLDYQTTRLLDYQTTRLLDYQTTRLLDYQTTRLLDYQTTRLLDYYQTTRLLLDYYQTTTRLLDYYQTTRLLLDYQTTTRLLDYKTTTTKRRPSWIFSNSVWIQKCC